MSDRQPTALLVHGVGFGASTMQPIADALALLDATPLDAVELFDRPGYGSRRDERPFESIEDAADDLLAQIADLRPPVVLIGVSGGATISVAAAAADPGAISALLVHEPVLGDLTPLLLEALTTAAEQLAETEHGIDKFLAALVGADAWSQVDARQRESFREASEVITAEVTSFLAYRPLVSDLEQLRPRPVITTIGGARGPAREEVALVLERHAGAERVQLARSGHLPQLDEPADFASVIASIARRLMGT